MTRAVEIPSDTVALVKSLFKRLYQIIGAEAAAAELGCSVQYIRALGSHTPQEDGSVVVPNLRHILVLEAAVGRPVVTQGLADLVTGAHGSGDLLHEACDVAEAAANLIHVARKPVSERERDKAIARLEREVADVTRLRAVND